jgi:hypothetical protein
VYVSTKGLSLADILFLLNTISRQLHLDFLKVYGVEGSLFTTAKGKGKVKAIPVQAWTGCEVSRRLRPPGFVTIGT